MSSESSVMVGFVHPGMVAGAFALSLAHLAPLVGPIMAVQSGPLVSIAREQIVGEFLKSDLRYLLFIDSDTVFDPEDVERLVSHDLPVVSGLVAQVEMDFEERSFYAKVHRLEDGLNEAERVGTAFTVIRRDVLEAVAERFASEEPWVFFRQDADADNRTEDWDFCRRARECGFSVWLDSDVRLGHVKPIPVYPPRPEDAA